MKAKNRVASHTAHAPHTTGHGSTNGRSKPDADSHPAPNAKSIAKATKAQKSKSRARKAPPKRKPRPTSTPRRASVAARFAKTIGYLQGVRHLAENYLHDRAEGMAERMKERSREAVHTAMNRLVGGAILFTTLVMVVVLTIRGIAGALAEAFGGRAWAGDLATAGLLVLGMGIGWATLKLFQESPPRPSQRSAATRRTAAHAA